MNSRSNGTKKPTNTVADLAKAKSEVKRWDKEVRLQRKNLGAVPTATLDGRRKAREALKAAEKAAQTTSVVIPGAPKIQNRVWIELDQPRDKEHAEQLCALANNMLQRLSRSPGVSLQSCFSWNDVRKIYEYGSVMGTKGLSDNGNWFDLDFLGRPLGLLRRARGSKS